MKMKRAHALFLSVMAVAAPNILAEDFGLETLLDDATEVVTSSKLNIDSTPSVVTVLEHDPMYLLGVKTLFEALGLLPGVETSINQFGIKKVIFRGFDNPNNFVFDKVKLLVDGVAIEMGKYGNSSFYYDLPIDMVERIEVLRGPGSALYGTGAFNGVINVVTRQSAGSGDTLFAGYGSYDYMMGGGHVGYRLPGGATLHVDGYYQRHDRRIDAGPAYTPVVLNRPYESSESLKDFSVGLTYRQGPWTFRSRVKNESNGNYFGWEEYLEERDDYRNVHKFLFGELEYTGRIAAETEWTVKLGYSRYDFDMTAGTYHIEPAIPLVIPFDIAITEQEEKGWLESSVNSRALEGHDITAGIALSSLRGVENQLYDSISPYGVRDLFKEGRIRNTYALYARDTVKVDTDLYALVSLRADYYSENRKTYPSAQLGLVYMANDAWHYKLNYGHAFRVPSWMEQYTVEYGFGDGTRAGNEDLKAETTDTIEAVAIWNSGHTHHLQTNVYYSVINDVIDIDDTLAPASEYGNLDRRKSYGIEMAYTWVTSGMNRLHLNASYSKTTYTGPLLDVEQSMPGVAGVMFKGYYTHYLTPATTLSTLVKYFGQRSRNRDFDGAPDGPYDLGYSDYATVDVTLATTFVKGWTLTASVKNLFDEEIFYPSYNATHPEGIPREGRNFLLQGEYRF